MRVLTGCHDLVSAQALHALLLAEAPSLGLTTLYHAARAAGGQRCGCRTPTDGPVGRTGCVPPTGTATTAVPRLQHTPPADTDIVERRASRHACDIGFAAEHTVDLTGAICAAHPSFRNQGVSPMYLEPRPGIAWPSPHLRELKDAVRALLGLDDDTAVIIRQLTCSEPSHPPLETVVAVLPMDGEAHRWTLHRPTDQITENDLRATLLHHRPS